MTQFTLYTIYLLWVLNPENTIFLLNLFKFQGMQDFRLLRSFLSLQIWPHAVRGQVLFSLLPKNWVTTILLILLIVESTKDLLWLFSFCCYWTFFSLFYRWMDPSCALLFRNNLAAVAAEKLSIHRVLKALEVVTDRDVLGISRKAISTNHRFDYFLWSYLYVALMIFIFSIKKTKKS